MKNYLPPFVLIWLLSCQPPPAATTGRTPPVDTLQMKINPETADVTDTSAYFQASGTEPFWNIRLSDTQIQFTSLVERFKKFTTPHVEPVRAMDANVKRYQADTESGGLVVEIRQQLCTNAMSGKNFPYQVSVSIQRGTDQEPTAFEGCGAYIPDYRLHDLWVLDSLEGTPASALPFEEERPMMEINTREATFMGFAGCNRMRGKLFAERDLLRFTDIITTRMACPPGNAEAQFLTALRAATTFRIGNNRLFLSNPNGERLVFKKID